MLGNLKLVGRSQCPLKIFTGRAHRELAEEICNELDVPLGEAEIIEFENDNTFVRIKESVREADVFVIQPACAPVNDNIMELLIMLDAIKYASAARITAVLPYFPYVRSDKKDEARISIIAKLMADLIMTAGADRVVTMDLHSPQIHGFFNIPVDHLRSMNIVADYFREKDLTDFTVVATDAGGAKRAGALANKLDLPLAIFDKRRSDDGLHTMVANVIGKVKGRSCILFDDEVSTGGSMSNTVKVLKERGATDIYAAVAHGVLCKNAYEKIADSEIKELIVTNSLKIDETKNTEKIKVLSVAKLFARAIKRIHNGESISCLFDDKHY